MSVNPNPGILQYQGSAHAVLLPIPDRRLRSVLVVLSRSVTEQATSWVLMTARGNRAIAERHRK